jgi:hypothetical protein
MSDSSGNLVSGSFVMTDVRMMHNGVSLACVNDLVNDRSLVVKSTGTGAKWAGIASFQSYSALVTGYSLTDYGNISLSVSYSGSVPSTGRLRGLSLYLNDVEFAIIENTQSTIVVYGSSIVDSITGTEKDVAKISPPTFNVVSELPEGEVCIGTSNGMLTDRGVYLKSKSSSSGIVKGIGVKAVVSSLNISGTIKSLVFQTVAKTMIAVSLDRVVKANKLAGYKLKFAGFTDMTVVSNESSKVDGLTTVIVTCDWTAVPLGLKFSAISDNNIIYVSFDSYVSQGDLSGGKLFLGPSTSDIVPASDSVLSLDIVSNGVDYIELKKREDANSGSVSDSVVDWKSVFVPGKVVYSTLSNGTLPIYVEFSKRPSIGALRGNKMKFSDVSGNILDAEIQISDNREKTLYVPYEFTAKLYLNGTLSNASSVFYVYSAIFEGDDFVLSNASFESDDVFNSRRTSVESSHYHEISLFGKDITGNVSSLGDSTSTYVDINVSGISDLSSEPFSSNPTLLSGQTVVVYNPEHYSHIYYLTIISTSSSSIRVKSGQDVFNTTGLSPNKISAGFSFLIDASRYGVTSSVEFSSDFIVRKAYLTDTTYLKGTTITVQSTAGFSAGEKIVFKDRENLVFRTEVSAIISPTQFEVSDQSPFDLSVLKDAYYEVLFTTVQIGKYDLALTTSVGESTFFVSDTSSMLEGDAIVVYDDKGLLFSSKVSSIVGPTSFDTEDASNADFTAASGAFAIVNRSNFSDGHSHIIRSGEFSMVSDSDWYQRGYNYYHGHVVSPLLKEVYDISVMYGKSYVVGSDSKVYESRDSGYSWLESINFEKIGEFNPVPVAIQKICTNGNDILFGTNSGYVVYFSTVIPSVVVPLSFPVG